MAKPTKKNKPSRGGSRPGAGRKKAIDTGQELKARYVAYLKPSEIDPVLKESNISFTKYVESTLKK